LTLPAPAVRFCPPPDPNGQRCGPSSKRLWPHGANSCSGSVVCGRGQPATGCDLVLRGPNGWPPFIMSKHRDEMPPHQPLRRWLRPPKHVLQMDQPEFPPLGYARGTPQYEGVQWARLIGSRALVRGAWTEKRQRRWDHANTLSLMDEYCI